MGPGGGGGPLAWCPAVTPATPQKSLTAGLGWGRQSVGEGRVSQLHRPPGLQAQKAPRSLREDQISVAPRPTGWLCRWWGEGGPCWWQARELSSKAVNLP